MVLMMPKTGSTVYCRCLYFAFSASVLSFSAIFMRQGALTSRGVLASASGGGESHKDVPCGTGKRNQNLDLLGFQGLYCFALSIARICKNCLGLPNHFAAFCFSSETEKML